MTRTYEPGEDLSAGPDVPQSDGVAESGTAWAEGAGDLGAETADLIAQIRQLAAHDPVGVQQVVSDVLAALDRATGGTVELSDEDPLDGRPAPTSLS